MIKAVDYWAKLVFPLLVSSAVKVDTNDCLNARNLLHMMYCIVLEKKINILGLLPPQKVFVI